MPTLTQADLRINYQVIGPELTPSVTPLALIHGLGANLAFWYLGPLRHLGRDRPVLLHDLRGHGASSMPQSGYGLEHLADDFRRLLDQLGIAQAHVVGHSHGARVALLFALLHPERVASLTLADTQIRALQPPMRLGDWPHWPQWKADLTARGVTQFPSDDEVIDFRLLAELGPRSAGGAGPAAIAQRAVEEPDLTERPGTLRGRLRRAGGAPALAGAGLVAQVAATGRRIDLHSRQMGARGSQQWQTLLETTTAPTEMHDETRIVPAELPALKMPVLLLYGQLSHCVPTADRLLQVLPNARRVLVPGGGHFFPIVKPQFFTRALRVFLARAETGVPLDKAALRREARSAGMGAPLATARNEPTAADTPVTERPRPALARLARRARSQRGDV